MDFQEQLEKLQSLDPKSIGNWPAAAKGAVLGLLCVAILGLGYWFDTKNQIVALDSARSEETELLRVLDTKQRQAASLEPLKTQLAEMKESFGALLRLLPNETEVEALLVDISQAGLGAGLEFEQFRPQNEAKDEFIATLPISIQVTGTYHEFGEFISLVAALPRIVTQHQVSISPNGSGSEPGDVQLSMSLQARTYRYLEEDEIEAQN